MTAQQRSLLEALEPIDPRTMVDRIPGVDAPCLCDPDRRETCRWPFAPECWGLSPDRTNESEDA